MVIPDIEWKLPDLVMENWYRHCTLHKVPLDQPGDAKKLTLLTDFMEAELKMKLYQHGADPRKWNQQGSGNGNGNSSNRNGGVNGNGKNGEHEKTASNFATETVSVKEPEAAATSTETNVATYMGKKGEGKKAMAPTGGAAEEMLFLWHLKSPGLLVQKEKGPQGDVAVGQKGWPLHQLSQVGAFCQKLHERSVRREWVSKETPSVAALEERVRRNGVPRGKDPEGRTEQTWGFPPGKKIGT